MKVLALIFILCTTGCGLTLPTSLPDVKMPDSISFDTSPTVYTLKRVIDGDEVILQKYETDYHVKLIGVDSPRKGDRLEERAKSALEHWLSLGKIRVEFDGQRKDIEGRRTAFLVLDVPPKNQPSIHPHQSKLPRIYMGKDKLTRHEWVCVNMLIVRDGYSRYRHSAASSKYKSWFEICQKEAREAGRGVWKRR